jgi:hypothetical protein
MKATSAFVSWLVVALVGVFVVALVAGITLIPRLNAANRVLDHGKPVFATQRVAGDRAGITFISHAVNTLDPITTPQGGAAAEVPKLVAFVSKQTGLSQKQVLTALTKNFPHTTALLEAIPLSSVTGELNGLVKFLATALHATPVQVLGGLKTSFPALYQAITNLPFVTSGWNHVPGTANLTRFNGAPVHTVPQVRTYFSADVIPVLEKQRTHFQALDGTDGVAFLAPLLLTVGIVVVIFGVAMALFARKGLPRELAVAAWGVVIAVGAAIIVVVFALNLFPRLDGGQNLLDQAKPAFNATRVQGDQASITMVGHVVNFAAPAVTPQGGAAAEVPALIAAVSKQTHLSQAAVLAALTKNFPHTTALLTALPLSAVTSELPHLLTFLGNVLHLSTPQVTGALKTSFPALYQAVTNLPVVTGQWNNIAGTSGLTNFAGAPVHSMPQMGAYLATDVVPFLATEQQDFTTVTSSWPRLPVFPPLLLAVGIIVVLYGALMMFLTLRRPRPAVAAAAAAPAPERVHARAGT